MSTWTCMNHKSANMRQQHFIFVEAGTDRVAIADHSLRDLDDPASTDDGLLVWSGTTGEWHTNSLGGYSLHIRVQTADGEGSWVSLSPHTAKDIEDATGQRITPSSVSIGPFVYVR